MAGAIFGYLNVFSAFSEVNLEKSLSSLAEKSFFSSSIDSADSYSAVSSLSFSICS